MQERVEIECLVVGGGPAGLAAAGALARCGAAVAIVVPSAAALNGSMGGDARTAALTPANITLLDHLGAWQALAPVSAPLLAIRLVDDTGNMLRAPEVTFRAAEIGRADLGWNVPNGALTAALADAARRSGIRVIADGAVTGVEVTDTRAIATTAGGTTIEARLVVGADGRGSICRRAAGIATRERSYGQTALTTRFSHSRQHYGASTELHRAAGPCTTVPLPGNASALVWVEQHEEAARLAALDADRFVAALSERLGGLLGVITKPARRHAFALAGLTAETLGRRRIALVGEAGHVLPPIGAQGLNLGLTDAAVLADIVAATRVAGGTVGGNQMLADYDAARAADLRMRRGAVDLLNMSLTSGLLPIDLARGAGLHVLAGSATLRRELVERGLAPPSPVPSLMRSGADRAALPSRFTGESAR